MRAAVVKKGREHWQHVVGELQESRQTWRWIMDRMKGRELTKRQVRLIKSQLIDVFRILPASGLAIANAALPVPGTGWFTPWILLKLGLMPSRWREAYSLKRLEREYKHLQTIGADDLADELGAVIESIDRDVERREEIMRVCALLTHWDANDNGRWDADERLAYLEAVKGMRRLRDRKMRHKNWFLQLHGLVFGPVCLDEVGGYDSDLPILICYGTKTGWISLRDLLSAETPIGPGLVHKKKATGFGSPM